MTVSRIVVCASLVIATTGLASAKQMSDRERLRAEAEHICYDDVQRLCGDFIPDEDQIKVCMGKKRAQLGPACGKIFDKGIE